MKTDDAWYVFGRRCVIGHVVRGKPILIAPDITQRYQHEPGEVENEFFEWNCSAHGQYLPTKSGRFIWENEKGVAKQQVEQKTQGCQHSERSPERFSRKLQIGSARKPPPSAPIGIKTRAGSMCIQAALDCPTWLEMAGE